MTLPPDPRAQESRQSPGRVPRRVPPDIADAIGMRGQNGTAVQENTRVAVRARARIRGWVESCTAVPNLTLSKENQYV